MENLRKYEKMIGSVEMQSSYLDNFELKSLNLPKVSAIVPTYNRSPHSARDDANPLGWCLESLLAQKGEVLDEIIVMDDASTDFTHEVVSDFQQKSDIDIKYFRNKENVGSSVNRNKAVEKSRNSHIMFLDDDCVFSPYFVFGGAFTLDKLSDNVAALHMPVYHRKTKPSLGRIEEIGILDLETGLMTGNYGCFPESYLECLDDNFLDENLKIIKPFEINNLGGVFIAKKDQFQEIGGFPEFLVWKNGYREETNVAIELINRGYEIFFTPDPKFNSIHLKYGAKGSENMENVRDPKLRRLISYSSVNKDDTGNRVDSEEWFFDRIISTYVTLGRQNMEAAENYMREIRTEFVLDNDLSVSGVGVKIKDIMTRRQIFNRAISEGNKLIEKRA